MWHLHVNYLHDFQVVDVHITLVAGQTIPITKNNIMKIIIP